jgi:hypothetical protein
LSSIEQRGYSGNKLRNIDFLAANDLRRVGVLPIIPWFSERHLETQVAMTGARASRIPGLGV